jgi:putative FmdB family regulatory protein
MPIYEYQSTDESKGCRKCRNKFEVFQGISEEPLSVCPDCGTDIIKVISWCRALVIEPSDYQAGVESKVSEYERQGMWSHAAELSDKYAEKAKDQNAKTRALENYKKAGYDVDSLQKSAAPKDD